MMIFSQIMNDGIMPILMKLAKLELPTLKLDISRALFFMTTINGPETTKVLAMLSLSCPY